MQTVAKNIQNYSSHLVNTVDIKTALTDERLYQLCKRFGGNAIYWRQKFIGLLPEVNRRRLFEKKGFESIFVFAKKLAGLSEEQVRRVLNIEKRLESTPILHDMLVNGEVSVNKLLRVISIATPENEEFLANQVQLLPKSAIDTLVRDEKRNGLDQTKNDGKSVPGHAQSEINQPILQLSSVPTSGSHGDDLQLSPEIRARLFRSAKEKNRY